jgi:16S rRNA (uracil1498-N3)-methyltransferase
MRISRIYQATKLSPNTTITLATGAANHLTRVLRLVIGDELQIFNAEDGEFSASIKEINKQQVIIQLDKKLIINNESPIQIHLGQASARGEKMDWIIQKATELGVAQITPLITERCGVKLSEERWSKRLQHWQAVAISACEQCGRNKIPIINGPLILIDWLQHCQQAVIPAQAGIQLFVLDPQSQQKIKTQLTDKTIQDVVLLVGPEGGLSETEVNFTKQNDFIAVCLGPRVLRTETAGIAAIAAIQCLIGDF